MHAESHDSEVASHGQSTVAGANNAEGDILCALAHRPETIALLGVRVL
jgi:hypothetical protein